LGVGHDGLLDRQVLLEDGAEIDLRRQAELDVDVGEAEIAVEQQHAPAGLRQRMGEGDRQPGLADAALARGHGNGVGRTGTSRRDGGGQSRLDHSLFLVASAAPSPASPAACIIRRARDTGLTGCSPSAIWGDMPISAKWSLAASAAATMPP